VDRIRVEVWLCGGMTPAAVTVDDQVEATDLVGLVAETLGRLRRVAPWLGPEGQAAVDTFASRWDPVTGALLSGRRRAAEIPAETASALLDELAELVERVPATLAARDRRTATPSLAGLAGLAARLRQAARG
jgi:hypothetical protein